MFKEILTTFANF